jgi:hypothetical protein
MVHRSCYELELAILISVSARCAEKEEDGLTLKLETTRIQSKQGTQHKISVVTPTNLNPN